MCVEILNCNPKGVWLFRAVYLIFFIYLLIVSIYKELR